MEKKLQSENLQMMVSFPFEKGKKLYKKNKG